MDNACTSISKQAKSKLGASLARPLIAVGRELVLETSRVLYDCWPLDRGRSRAVRALLKIAAGGERRRVVTSADGRRFLLDMDNTMHLPVLLGGEYEPAETAVMRALVRPGDRVIDLGANFGWYTTLLALLVGPTGRVHAFEPCPPALGDLRTNLHLSGLTERVEVYASAAGRAAGQTTIHLFSGLPQGHASESSLGRTDYVAFPAPVVMLDDALPDVGSEGYAFLKCDVEGAEMAAFVGASRLLTAVEAPIVMCEMNFETSETFGYRPYDVLAHLRAHGYLDWYKVESEPEPHISPLSNALHVRHGDTILCVPTSRRERIDRYLAGRAPA